MEERHIWKREKKLNRAAVNVCEGYFFLFICLFSFSIPQVGSEGKDTEDVKEKIWRREKKLNRIVRKVC